MKPRADIRLAPGGSAIPLGALRALLRETDARDSLQRGLEARFPGWRPTFHASGREAMRAVFAALKATSGRDEVAIPAYACFSIPASAVAAGLHVRLIDIDERGQLSLGALGKASLERVAAIVVGNLFGVPEPMAAVRRAAREGGAQIIDDAAQSLGAGSRDGAVGSRGDVGILSFGRGKPISALAGGAALWPAAPTPLTIGSDAARPDRTSAFLRAVAYDFAREPHVLRLLAAIPSLEIGVTSYDPAFDRGEMHGAAVALAAALLPELDAMNDDRRQRAHTLAERLLQDTAFVPLLETPGDRAIFPRLALRAPSKARRDEAHAALIAYGATRMYPTPLDAIAALAPHRSDSAPCPGAHDFCDRLLTLPTHAGLDPSRSDEVTRILARL